VNLYDFINKKLASQQTNPASQRTLKFHADLHRSSSTFPWFPSSFFIMVESGGKPPWM
jgi:hypothetical protein